NGRANHLVIVAQSLQTAITPPVISLNSSPGLNRFTHRWLQAGSGGVINACKANSANLASISLSGDQNQRLASGSTASLAGMGCPNEGLVDFNGASQTISTWPHHCSPKLMQPGPSRAVAAQPQHPLHAQRARTRFLIGNIPDSLEPNSQRFVGVGKQSAGSYRKVVTAVRTSVERRSHLPNLKAVTIRTGDAKRPTQSNQVVTASLLVRKSVAKFHNRLWMVGHVSKILHVVVRGIKCIPRLKIRAMHLTLVPMREGVGTA